MPAAFILWFLLRESQFLRETTPTENFPAYKVAILEFLLTFFLKIVIINVSTRSKEMGTMSGIALNGVTLLEAMFDRPMRKTSINPIRSIAPALFTVNFQYLRLYNAAPFFGALNAISSCKLVKEEQCC